MKTTEYFTQLEKEIIKTIAGSKRATAYNKQLDILSTKIDESVSEFEEHMYFEIFKKIFKLKSNRNSIKTHTDCLVFNNID